MMKPFGSVLKRRRGSLPWRITLYVFVATVLVSLIVTWVSVSSIHGFLASELERKFPRILIGVAERVELWYSGIRVDVQTFAGSPLVVRRVVGALPAQAEVGDYLEYVLGQFPAFSSIFLLDAKGATLDAVGEQPPLPTGLRQELASVAGWRIRDFERVGSRRIQLVSVDVTDPAGSAVGSLHAVIRLTALEEQLASEPLTGGALYLVRSNGSYLAGTSEAPDWETFPGPLPGSGDEPVVDDYVAPNGERMVLSTVRIPRFGWVLALEQPYAAAFSPSVSLLSKVLAINLATVLLFGLVTFRLALWLTRPIRSLEDVARRISQGESDVEIDESRAPGELGLLTQAFKSMLAKLEQSREEIRAKNLKIESSNARLRARNEDFQRLNEELEQLSITDGLTRLYNHRYFQEHLRREIARAERADEELSLVLIDIDDFKQLNDRHGHAIGDIVLREVAAVMRSVTRESDVLARYGGEEFALVPGQTSLEGAAGLAEKIRVAIAEADFEVLEAGPDRCLEVTVSLGVARFRGDTAAFFNDADSALYEAKSSGKNCVVTHY